MGFLFYVECRRSWICDEITISFDRKMYKPVFSSINYYLGYFYAVVIKDSTAAEWYFLCSSSPEMYYYYCPTPVWIAYWRCIWPSRHSSWLDLWNHSYVNVVSIRTVAVNLSSLNHNSRPLWNQIISLPTLKMGVWKISYTPTKWISLMM